MKLILSLMKSEFGWYCRYEKVNKYGQTIKKEGRGFYYEDGQIWGRIKDKEQALKKFEKTIEDFGGNLEDNTIKNYGKNRYYSEITC